MVSDTLSGGGPNYAANIQIRTVVPTIESPTSAGDRKVNPNLLLRSSDPGWRRGCGLRENVDDSNVRRLFSIGAPHRISGICIGLWTSRRPDEATGSGDVRSRSCPLVPRTTGSMTVRVGVGRLSGTFSHEDFTVRTRTGSRTSGSPTTPTAQADMEAAFAAMVARSASTSICHFATRRVAERPAPAPEPPISALLYDPETDGFVRLPDRGICAGGWSDRRTGELVAHDGQGDLVRFSDPTTENVTARWESPPQRFPSLRSFGAAYLSCDSPRGKPGAFAELRITSEYSPDSKKYYGLRVEGTSGGVVLKHTFSESFDDYVVLREIGSPPWIGRLPSMPGYAWTVEIRANVTVRGAHLADDPSEFMAVRG